MESKYYFLSDCILFSEFIAALMAILYFQKVKDTFWKWFVFYLVFIFVAEIISKLILDDYVTIKKYYYNFFVIPIEFFFLYWLYAYKSLANKKLFYIISTIYSISLLIYLVVHVQLNSISSINYTLGTLLLLVLIVMEFRNQIQSEKIIFFKQNMMFYVNLGIILFFIGTLPFYAFNQVLYENSRNLWNNYSIFALVLDSVMYLLFAVSFIWGKPNT